MEQEKRRWLLASIFLNALLALVKLGWGIVSGSTVVLADAIHSIADVFGTLLVYLSVRFASYHSKRFPLGLYKLEDMAAVIAGVGVLLAGYEILRSVFVEGGVSAPSSPWMTLLFMVAIISIQTAFYIYEKRAALRLRSPGLGSDVANWLGDIGAGVVVLVSVGGYLLHIPYIQEVAVVIIALLIFHSAYEVMRDSLLALLDASVALPEEQQAWEYLRSVPCVERVISIVIRKAGSTLFLKTTLELEAQSFNQAHQLVDTIEAELMTRIPSLEAVTVHYEPVKKSYQRIASLFEADRMTPVTLFGNTHSILLQDFPLQDTASGSTSRIPINETWVINPYQGDSHGKAIKLAVWLIGQHVNQLYFNTDNLPSDSEPDVLTTLLAEVGISVVPYIRS